MHRRRGSTTAAAAATAAATRIGGGVRGSRGVVRVGILACLCLAFVQYNFNRSRQQQKLNWQQQRQRSPENQEEDRKKLYSIEEQDDWIRNEFRAIDETHQEWCVRALLKGNHWGSKDYQGGAQYSQDTFLARNVFFKDYLLNGRKGFYVEAGANHYRHISSTYFYDKCLGWEGLCVEPQSRHHPGLQQNRSCMLVPKCLSKEKTDDMMVGGLPYQRSGGMYIRPIPKSGIVPNNTSSEPNEQKRIIWERVSCAPLDDMLDEYYYSNKTTTTTTTGSSSAVDHNHDRKRKNKYHVDLFVLDVEGAELMVLDTIDWSKNSFTVLQVERHQTERQKGDMLRRMYKDLYDMETDTIFVPVDEYEKYPKYSKSSSSQQQQQQQQQQQDTLLWLPGGNNNIVRLK